LSLSVFDHCPRSRHYVNLVVAGKHTLLHMKQQLKDKLVEHKQYIDKHGEDLPEFRNWTWGR
jgi:phosphoketolase